MVLTLPPQLTIREVSSFYTLLQDGLQHSSVEVDASGVARIDTPAVQLLMSFRDEVLRLHKSFSWCATGSETFLSAVATLGMVEHLGLGTQYQNS